jgi:hypothetical protein
MHRSPRTLLLCLAPLGLACGGGATFQGQARTSAPAFAARTSTTQPLELGRSRAALDPGSPLNAVFQLLRDYEFPRDEGRVDMSNVYKVLHTADDTLALGRAACAPIPAQEVAAPFPLGAAGTYTCAGDDQRQAGYRSGFALREVGTATEALLTFRWAPDAAQQQARGELQGRLDGATGEVELTMVNLVEYPPGSTMGGASGDGFALRTSLVGNGTTHHFTLRALTASTRDAQGGTSLVGKGVSRGAGEVFLFRVWQGAPGGPGRYFCLPGDVGEAGLDALDPLGSEAPSAACAAYAAEVDALVPLTRAEVPLRASDFAGGDIGLRWQP